MTDIDFTILNSHVTSRYLIFIKRTYTEKTEKIEEITNSCTTEEFY